MRVCIHLSACCSLSAHPSGALSSSFRHVSSTNPDKKLDPALRREHYVSNMSNDARNNKITKTTSRPHTITRAAKPTREIFDAFNSSATGHQRADNRLSGSTHWRDSRSAKLAVQFASGLGGGRRVADTVGAGAEDFGKDGRAANGGWLPGAKGLRGKGQRSLWDAFGGKQTSDADQRQDDALRIIKAVHPACDVVDKLRPALDRLEKAVCKPNPETGTPNPARLRSSQEQYEDDLLADIDFAAPVDLEDPPHDQHNPLESTSTAADRESRPAIADHDHEQTSHIFRNLTIYVNGSTAPLISDHKLKRILVDHGANLSIALGRRSVTHVVLGQPNANKGGGTGAGGGLASSKIQKEIAQTRNRGAGVRFVTAEWVVQSVRAGKRLPEGKFEAMKLAPKGVKSVASMFAREGK